MDELVVRRCIATSKTTGERCNRAPIVGGYVCSMHGGKAPLAVAAAKQRLLAMVEPALDALLRALQSGNPCEVCGRSDDMGLVIRAAQIVLDRAGHGPSAHLTVARGVTKSSPVVEWMTPEELRLLDAVFEEANRRMVAGEPKQNTTLVEASTITTVRRVIVPATTVDELAERAERLATHLRHRAELEAARPVIDNGYLVPEDGPDDAPTAPSQDEMNLSNRDDLPIVSTVPDGDSTL